MAIISIFGLAGTGTSTCGKMLAKKLGYKFYSTGGLFRSLALERGMTLYEYEKLVHENPDMDKSFDEKVRELGRNEDNFVIDSRLAWYFIPHSLKVKFTCDFNTRIKRVAERDGISYEEALEKTNIREADHAERFNKLYEGITDYTSDGNFDLIIDSGKKSPEEIVGEVEKLGGF